MDQVFVKTDIRKDMKYVGRRHLYLSWGLVLAFMAGLGIFLIVLFEVPKDYFKFDIPYPVTAVLCAVPLILLILIIAVKDKKIKSTAFILRDGVLYYIRLTYMLKDNVFLAGIDEKTEDRCNIFSVYLNKVVNAPSGKYFPDDIREFIQMNEFTIEKRHKGSFVISYSSFETNGEKKTKKFRNVYDSVFFESVKNASAAKEQRQRVIY